MKKRAVGNRQPTTLVYETLELRQMFTSIAFVLPSTLHMPQDASAIVQTGLTTAPDISQQPEHGALQFDKDNGTLTYRPDKGFTGADTFQLADQTYTMRVWDPVYAVSDWAHVRPGSFATIDVLGNDYSFRKGGSELEYSQIGSFRFASDYQWQRDASGFKIVEIAGGSFGKFLISRDGRSLDYTPAAGFSGTDSVSYTLEDALGHRSSAAVTIDVSEQDVNGRYFVSEGQWKQRQIDDWLESYASSLTSGSYRHWLIDTLSLGLTATTTARLNIQADAFFLDQVTNVQEGDIVKSHGSFLYYVTHNRGEGEFASYLSIVDVSDPAAPTMVSTTGFDRRIRDVFLGEGRAAVVFDQSVITTMDRMDLVDPVFELVVLDVTNPETPSEVYRATIDGSYREGRLIGDELFVISDSPDAGGPVPWQLIDDSINIAVSPGDYINALIERDNHLGLPTITIDSQGVTKTIAVGANQIVKRENTPTSTLVTTFDLQSSTGTPVDVDLVESALVQTVYVSTTGIYLFDGDSVIKMSFVVDGTGVEFAADGLLNGRLLSQFAADEHEGYLRVALNDWEDGSSDIRIFNQIDDQLVVVGRIDDIAPGERIFSTLFAEEQVFVVTFRQIDPLFVIDLRIPTDPKIAGELKIPGVSGYLQLIGDDLLLGIGRDAVMGRFTALQISLFDISDPNSPQLLDRYTFDGGRSTMTPLIEWPGIAPEHHALTFDPSTGTLALPIFSMVGWNGEGKPIVNDETSAVSLFQIDREHGIRATGQADFDSRALRTIIVGDNLVYLSEDELKTASRLAPTEILAKMEFPTDQATKLAARPAVPVPDVPDVPLREVPQVVESPVVIEPPETIAPVEQSPIEAQPFDGNLFSFLINIDHDHEAGRSIDSSLSSGFAKTDGDGIFSRVTSLAGPEQILAGKVDNSLAMSRVYQVSEPDESSSLDAFFAGLEFAADIESFSLVN